MYPALAFFDIRRTVQKTEKRIYYKIENVRIAKKVITMCMVVLSYIENEMQHF